MKSEAHTKLRIGSRAVWLAVVGTILAILPSSIAETLTLGPLKVESRTVFLAWVMFLLAAFVALNAVRGVQEVRDDVARKEWLAVGLGVAVRLWVMLFCFSMGSSVVETVSGKTAGAFSTKAFELLMTSFLAFIKLIVPLFVLRLGLTAIDLLRGMLKKHEYVVAFLLALTCISALLGLLFVGYLELRSR